MAFVFLLRAVMQRRSLTMTKLEGFMMAWLAFVVLHSLLVPLCEEYRTVYLCLSLLLAILLANMQRDELLSRGYIESVLLFVACVHLVFIIGQFIITILASMRPIIITIYMYLIMCILSIYGEGDKKLGFNTRSQTPNL